MLSSLKDHPFAVNAFFESSVVLTFAIPKEQLVNMIPPCLTLDTWQDKWGFIAVAMVQTKALRPAGFPSIFGNDFFLIGYRIFVRYRNKEGRNLRGLYIIKSETDKKKMQLLGNIFTHYNYTTTDIKLSRFDNFTSIVSKASNLNITFENADETDVELPVNSPFSTWKEARRFAGPMPFTFTYNEGKKHVTIIEGKRENWQPCPIKIINYEVGFLNSMGLVQPLLANAFIVTRIPYHWKKGKIEKWEA